MSPEEKANARFEQAVKKAEESKEKFLAKEKAKAEREAKKAENPTPWSSTFGIMTKNPDIEIKDLKAQLSELGVDVEKSNSTIQTTYAYVRRIVKGLRESGLMK
jgi:arginyl-tRNA synthetase